MRKAILVLVFAAIGFAAPASAAIKSCNASRISSGDCAASSQTLILFAITTTELVEIADEVAEQFGYPNILCTSADVTASRCAAGQLGQVVVTPEPKNQFANRKFGELIRRFVLERRQRLAAEAAAAGVAQPGAIE